MQQLWHTNDGEYSFDEDIVTGNKSTSLSPIWSPQKQYEKVFFGIITQSRLIYHKSYCFSIIPNTIIFVYWVYRKINSISQL